jgi:hypothetical protein
MGESCRCGGICMEKNETAVMRLPHGTDQLVQCKYYVCLECGKEHQTEKQQAAVMLELYSRIPEEEYDEEDKFMIESLKEVVVEEKVIPER